MERQDESIRDLLLARLPQPQNMTAYQEEVNSLLAANDKKLRRSKQTIVRMWIFVVVIAVPFLWMAGSHFNTPQGNWFLGLACVWVLLGAFEVLKYEVHQGRVELLKELKQVQLQILDVQAALTPTSDKR